MRAPTARGALAAAFIVGAAGEAWARAGGGGHSGGGGHTSSSTGYSGGGHVSSGSGDGLSFGGFITLLILAAIAWYLYRRFTRAAGSGGPSTVAREALGAALGAAIAGGRGPAGGGAAGPGAAAPRQPLPPAVDAIRTLDPAFEMETFLQRAEMTFFLVKRGFQNNDAAAIRPYLNDAVFAAASGSISQMKSQHRHTLLESLNVRALHLVQAAATAQGQSLQIHFDLVYRAKTFDDANRVLADEGGDGRHGERWTFVRAANAKTPVSGGVTASRCPACGAELRLSLDGTCTHCRASVTNGTVDWVVADVQNAPFLGIPSDSVYVAGGPTFMEAIASLRAADPAFSIDAFRTRVRTGFLALQSAWCQQNLEAGRAFLSPGAYFAWRAQLETMTAEGRRNVMENVEVRSIEVMHVVHGRVFDDLTVRITAAAADYEVDKAGKLVFGDREVRPFREEWTFQRSVGVATSNKPGTLENTCPSCGAPVALTQIGECRYCKAAVTSGKFDWVVSRIEQEQDGDDAGGGGGNVGEQIALQVGGAIVGGLLGSLLSGGGKSSSDWDSDN
jgi:predicted lipid-binding transport protein (Tim44 family)